MELNDVKIAKILTNLNKNKKEKVIGKIIMIKNFKTNSKNMNKNIMKN